MSRGRTLTIYLAADTKRASNSINTFGKTLGNLGKIAGVAAIAGLAVLTKAAIDYGREAIALAEAQSTANARIDQVAKSMGFVGKQYEGATDRIKELARQTALATGIDRVQIQETQAKLLTFRNLGKTVDETGGAFDQATQLALDLAATGFGTATTNAVVLGKALNDPVGGISALTRVGIQFTEQQKEQIKAMVEAGDIAGAQAIIMGELEAQVGGVAEATANASDRMNRAWDDLKLQVGEALLPIFEDFVEFVISTVVPWLQEQLPKAIAVAREAFDRLSKFWKESLEPAFISMKNWWEGNGAGVMADMTDAADELGYAFDEVARVFGKFRDVLGTENDAGSTTGSLVNFLVQAAKVLAWAQSFSIRVVLMQFERLADVLLAIKETVSYVVNNIGKIQNPLQTIGELGSNISDAINPMQTGGGDFGKSSNARSTNITVNTGVGDPVAIGREIDRVLRLRDLRVGVA